MEGATKWNPICLKASDDPAVSALEVQRIYGHSSKLQQQLSADPAVSALEVELEQTRARIHELETQREASKKKLKHFLKNLSDERATWRSREHERIRAIINDMNADLNQERKTLQRLEIVNSKLVSELADAKLLIKRYMKDYEKEWKARELIEEVCYELAKEIREDKAEVEALKMECLKLCEEVEEERKILQIAEVWREERVQMKLVDAKIALDEKYSQMNKLVADLETFLTSKGAILDAEETRKAEFLRRAAISVNIQGFKEFSYGPPNQDDIFSVFEDVNVNDVHAMSPEINVCSKYGYKQTHSSAYFDQNGYEEDSGWETVSHPEDPGSSYSLEESDDPSVIEVHDGTNASGTPAEEAPITETREAGRAPKTYSEKVSSMSRFWNSGENHRTMIVEGINERLSTCSSSSIISRGGGSSKSRISSSDLCSVESGNRNITGRMQRRSLKTKLLEARMASQKIRIKKQQA